MEGEDAHHLVSAIVKILVILILNHTPASLLQSSIVAPNLFANANTAILSAFDHGLEVNVHFRAHACIPVRLHAMPICALWTCLPAFVCPEGFFIWPG
jgi:hypothetical protein